MKSKVLLIVPAYNEAKTIVKICQNAEKSEFDYVVVNDGSSDDTGLICNQNNFNCINLACNLGIGGAVQTGYKYAMENNYDIAVQFDADGQHDILYVGKLIQPIVDGSADFTIGSRFTDKTLSEFNSTWARRIGIKMISRLIKLFTGRKILDTTSGFRAANRKVIEKFAENYPTEYPEPVSDFELLKYGYRVKEIPVKMHAREDGKSSIHSWKKGYYMINVILSIIMVQMRGKHE